MLDNSLVTKADLGSVLAQNMNMLVTCDQSDLLILSLIVDGIEVGHVKYTLDAIAERTVWVEVVLVYREFRKKGYATKILLAGDRVLYQKVLRDSYRDGFWRHFRPRQGHKWTRFLASLRYKVYQGSGVTYPFP